jgi:hypothetical protein
MLEKTSPALGQRRLASLTTALSDYALRFGWSKPGQDAVAALEEALSDYVLRYGLTDHARSALGRPSDELALAQLLHDVNASIHEGEGTAPRSSR